MRKRRRMGWIGLASQCGLVLGLLVLSGCGGGGGGGYEGPLGKVSGKVTFQGEPIPEGSKIQFTNAEKAYSATGTIAADGSYTVTSPQWAGLPVGKYQVSVSPPAPRVSEDAAVEPPPPPEYPNIPQKYRSAKTSGETFEVKEGENSFDLDMKG